MKVGVLFSSGKDSAYAAFLAKRYGHRIGCLINIGPKNPYSFMFHSVNSSLVKKQAEVMGVPLVRILSKGEKEKELDDLERAIRLAIKRYKIEGVVSGAVESVYQATRIQKICNKLEIECFNPLWQKDQFELLNELIRNRFEVIVVGVFADPFNREMLGIKIDKSFVKMMKRFNEKYGINPSGEGGEYESFVLNCPLFKKKLEIRESKIYGEKYSWVMELRLK
jgi:ABC transporter with metal-binding/Fe-S-binding domain ATP-binding protein